MFRGTDYPLLVFGLTFALLVLSTAIGVTVIRKITMSRVWQSPDQCDRLIAAKGAPEAIVDLCHMDANKAAIVATQVRAMARDGLRVLGVARATFGAASLPE
jgi:magnesium-transporting ATPase (P-type)